jgi:N-carbamoylputrescine amidase
MTIARRDRRLGAAMGQYARSVHRSTPVYGSASVLTLRRYTIQRAHAIANGVYVASPNRIGHENEPGTNGITFFGHSFVADPFGRYIAEAGEDEHVLIARCDPSLIETVRRNWPFMRDRRVDAYGPILNRYIGAAL